MTDLHVIYREDELILSLDGVPYVVSVFEDRYEDVWEAISDRDFDALRMLLSTSKRVDKVTQTLEEYGLTTDGGAYYYQGNMLPCDLTDYILDAADRGNPTAIVNFVKRLFENPNHDTRMRLFTFIQRGKLPINDDGHVLAYKVVTPDYLDKHTCTVDNRPGVSVPRFTWAQVDTNNAHTCSRGYHVCSMDYLISGSFYSEGDRVVSTSFDPADVAAVPPDYNDSKLRCLQYKVLADITDQFVAYGEKTKLSSGFGGVNPQRDTSNWTNMRDFY